jgi:hypothetical protein
MTYRINNIQGVEKQSIETLPQEIKDDVNKILESCPEPVGGIVLFVFTNSGCARVASGKAPRKHLIEELEELLLYELSAERIENDLSSH